MGPQVPDPSSQDRLFRQVQRNARESRAAPSASLPLEAAWMLSVLEMFVTALSTLPRGNKKKAEIGGGRNQNWREGEESLGLCHLGTTAQAGPKRPSQLLPTGFGCECAVGEDFHPLCVLSTALCPPSPTPCPLPWRAGQATGTRHSRGAAAGRAHTVGSTTSR